MDAGEKPASFYMRMFGSGSYSFRPVGCAARFKRMGRDAYQNMRGNEMPNDPYYQTAKHKAWKEKVLRRAGYLCEECRRYGRLGRDGLPVRATTAHHIKHRIVTTKRIRKRAERAGTIGDSFPAFCSSGRAGARKGIPPGQDHQFRGIEHRRGQTLPSPRRKTNQRG